MLSPKELLNLLTPVGDNKTTLPLLVEQVQSPVGVIPFVGAGMSAPFKFPQWSEFLEGFASDEVKKQAIRAQLEAGKYEEAAQDLMDWRGENAFQDEMDRSFGPAQLEGKVLKGAVCLLPGLARGPILTTNFDQVLERAFEEGGRRFELVILGMKTDLIKKAFDLNLAHLIKLHGDAADRNDRVLTLREYKKRYDSDEPLKPVLHLAMGHPLLFLGCSLKQDRTVRVLEDLIRQNKGHDLVVNYAILEAPADPLVLQERGRFMRQQLGIRVVWFPTGRFDLIEELLQYLVDQRGARPEPGMQKIEPRGLRSFEASDHGSFLRLVPGPRDAHGVPASLSRWKERVEQRDADLTFKVGLIYGPSGCGKSSLLKAGLIPELSSGSILPICVTATADQTETLMLTELRKALGKLKEAAGDQAFPDLPAGLSLGHTMEWLLANPEASGKRKVVFFLDQFEQWLHGQQKGTDTDLAVALRHCDGGWLQAVLMARDDFQVAAHRFFQALGVPLHEGDNYWLVDLFDLKHARSVLVEYGRAYGRLPDVPGQPNDEQEAFLEKVIEVVKTAEDRVVCIRLVLLTEMLKDQEWTRDTLEKHGREQGIGKAFLEKNLGPNCKHPTLRTHRAAAGKVLESLLPEAGVNIRGSCRSVSELQQATGYAGRPEVFKELLTILDVDLKIITPTEGSIETPGESPAGESPSPEKSYQLTHDYLVSSLRGWLTKEQRKTARGRAILCLKERAAQWEAAPGFRFLPGPVEYLRIRCLAPRANRSESQSAMMRSAGWFYNGWLTALVCLVAVVFALREHTQNKQAKTLVQAVETAAPQAVPYAIELLRPMKHRALPILRATFRTETNSASQRKLQAAMALADFGEGGVTELLDFLLDRIAAAPRGQCANVVRALTKVKETAVPRLLNRIDKEETPAVRAKFATVALFLGVQAPLRGLTMLTTNPVDRTTFIHGYQTWPGDPLEVARILMNDITARTNDDLRSALCAAMGLIPVSDFTDLERDKLRRTMVRLRTAAPDGGTHSAATYALHRWGITNLPPLVPAGTIAVGADWFVNTLGMTMVRVPKGAFNMGDPQGGQEAKPHPVTLHEFYMADREVIVAQFMQFVEAVPKGSTNTPRDERIDDWAKYDTRTSPSPDCPVQKVSWFEAVKFCNWLSRREGRTPCYQVLSSNADDEEWDCNFKADGYRLPTEAEWERACRALSETQYAFGGPELFVEYGYALQNSLRQAWPAGGRLPNGWGLFDMYGNVWEWCHDWSSTAYPPGPCSDPTGPRKGVGRVLRGGCWGKEQEVCRSGFRYYSNPKTLDSSFGFRVVIVPGMQQGNSPPRL